MKKIPWHRIWIWIKRVLTILIGFFFVNSLYTSTQVVANKETAEAIIVDAFIITATVTYYIGRWHERTGR